MGVLTAVSFLFTAVVTGVVGVLIREFEMMELIAGYDPEQVTDDEGLARFIGTATLFLAGLTALVGGFELVRPVDDQPVVYTVYAVVTVLLVGYMIYGTQRYTS